MYTAIHITHPCRILHHYPHPHRALGIVAMVPSWCHCRRRAAPHSQPQFPPSWYHGRCCPPPPRIVAGTVLWAPSDYPASSGPQQWWGWWGRPGLSSFSVVVRRYRSWADLAGTPPGTWGGPNPKGEVHVPIGWRR